MADLIVWEWKTFLFNFNFLNLKNYIFWNNLIHLIRTVTICSMTALNYLQSIWPNKKKKKVFMLSLCLKYISSTTELLERSLTSLASSFLIWQVNFKENIEFSWAWTNKWGSWVMVSLYYQVAQLANFKSSQDWISVKSTWACTSISVQLSL